MAYRTRKSSYAKKRSYRKRSYIPRKTVSKLYRRISAVSRRVAGEVCKFESNPTMYSNTEIVTPSGTSWAAKVNTPLTTISSGSPWVMPLNWIYNSVIDTQLNAYPDQDRSVSVSSNNGSGISLNGEAITTYPAGTKFSIKNPIWYNTALQGAGESNPYNSAFTQDANGTDYQYRLKYLYINALFNASVASSINNTDGALRLVIVKDKQPTGGSATWYDANDTESHARGVFNAQRIDAQLNPRTVGRFKIMYDKTLRFTTTNGYKPFTYFKKTSNICRNNSLLNNATGANSSSTSGNTSNQWMTKERSPPVQKSAYYLMVFSDGLTFNYSSDPSTPAASFHLFNRVAYYNN